MRKTVLPRNWTIHAVLVFILIIMKWKNAHEKRERRKKAPSNRNTHSLLPLVNMNKMYKQLRYNKLHSFLLSLFAQCFIMHCICIFLYSICFVLLLLTILETNVFRVWQHMCVCVCIIIINLNVKVFCSHLGCLRLLRVSGLDFWHVVTYNGTHI